jgi:hypothetical protein
MKLNDVAAATMDVISEADKHMATYHQAYHELSNHHLVEMDVLEQLKANLAQLEDLHGRLKFMMVEITYLMKKT